MRTIFTKAPTMYYRQILTLKKHNGITGLQTRGYLGPSPKPPKAKSYGPRVFIPYDFPRAYEEFGIGMEDIEKKRVTLHHLYKRDYYFDNPTKITPKLYLGAEEPLVNYPNNKFLHRERITHILSVGHEHYETPPIINKGNHLNVTIPLYFPILLELPKCVEFIEQTLNGGGTLLVHGYTGADYSASVVNCLIMDSCLFS